jgi:hypothetical protein
MVRNPQSTLLWFRECLAVMTTGFNGSVARMSLFFGTVFFSLALAAENRAPQPDAAAVVASQNESSAANAPDDLAQKPNSDLQSNPEEAANDTQSEAQAPAPQAERLRSRSLGLGFEKFNPSEAISADNAVPFPIDI